MIGLPTEEDADVRSIVEDGKRMLGIGRGLTHGGKAEVTVSVSSHVPKPHTPLQWCAQDLIDEIRRKQTICGTPRRATRASGSSTTTAASRSSRACSRAVIAASPMSSRARGARARASTAGTSASTSSRWQDALAAHLVDVPAYLGTRPISARLPWDHIDVGLEDGFLLAEYRKAVKGRASPPCGKVAGMLIHHTNLEEAAPDRRKLVCYDCGVACDLTKMRAERLVALRTLGAEARPVARAPVVGEGDVDVSERGGGSPAEVADATSRRESDRNERVRLNGHHGAGAPYTTYRMRFAKVGRAAFLDASISCG